MTSVSTKHLPQAETAYLSPQVNATTVLEAGIAESWAKIAPFWPLKNLIAVNPLAGFEHLPFEVALQQGMAAFQQPELPGPMEKINRVTIKWLQAFFDDGQATLKMPMRQKGLLASMVALLPYDSDIYPNDNARRRWLTNLPQDPVAAVRTCLDYLAIPPDRQVDFMTLMLTTLPGWAAYVQYRTNWADAADARHPHPVSQSEYLALRLLLTCLAWDNAVALLNWQEEALHRTDTANQASQIDRQEQIFQVSLLKSLRGASKSEAANPEAQLIFCIDVRSEPFRRALEAQNSYQTFGFAGFFGLPISVHNPVSNESYASCPVLLKPVCQVQMQPTGQSETYRRVLVRNRSFKKLYQSLKYTFSTPFALVEALGAWSGLWMACRTLAPTLFAKLDKATNPDFDLEPTLAQIPFADQCAFAAGALTGMGLTKDFAPLIVFCGHGSATQNNAYATALDCGACGGHHGAPNARLLAHMLNQTSVRLALAEKNIAIPDDTYFLAALHTTTTDQVELFDAGIPAKHAVRLQTLKADLRNAHEHNCQSRALTMKATIPLAKAAENLGIRSIDWAQVRPEWGLARNAAFIIGPRSLTKNIDLQGRSFLHSYDWRQDRDGSVLTAIMTAPMVVGQWINAQYLFSSLDNVAYGGGSKVTQNITGKIGVMQGNASDLMHGLPFQSVAQSDTQPYHQPIRLTTVVQVPVALLDRVIKGQPILRKLFGNGWVLLYCLDPISGGTLRLNRDLSWELLLEH